ncbi:unnamed protein product, partial [Sphagnum compactum]
MYREACDQLTDVIVQCGCAQMTNEVGNKDKLVDCLCHFHVVVRCSMAMDQFKEGLQTLGVLNAAMQHSEMEAAFVYSERPLDASTIENLLPLTGWSQIGNNKFDQELRTQTYWRDFLQELE